MVCHTSALLSIEDAQQRMLGCASPPPRTESVNITKSLGRILAHSIVSSIDVPPFETSAMDGYAINAVDLPHPGITLPLSQIISAGVMPKALTPHTTARILTGAPVPEGADTVVIQESCTFHDQHIHFMATAQSGDNVRKQGCHIRQGQTVLECGKSLSAVDLGLLASIGRTTVDVYAPLRIGVISTGNELAMPGDKIMPGQIYNSNHIMLITLLSQMHCEVVDLGSIDDDLGLTQHTLNDAKNRCDVIISTGGASVGDKDYIKTAIENIGEISFWKINMKPGKPMAFGKLYNTDFIALPGNPVSCFVSFCLLARPFLLKRQGASQIWPTTRYVLANFTQNKTGKRTEYARASIQIDETGRYRATPYPRQDSATLLSISHSDGLVKIPAETIIKPGDQLTYYPFLELLK